MCGRADSARGEPAGLPGTSEEVPRGVQEIASITETEPTWAGSLAEMTDRS